MRKSFKFIPIALAVVMAVCFLAACGTASVQNATSKVEEHVDEVEEKVVEKTYDVLYTTNDVDIRKVGAEFVGETLNLQLTLANSMDEEKTIDVSKFALKTADGDMLKVNGNNKTVDANAMYRMWAFTVEDGGKVKVGDTVTVCYDGDEIASVEIGQF